MKTLLWVFWPLKKGVSWKDRAKMLGYLLLLMSGMLAIGVFGYLIDGPLK